MGQPNPWTTPYWHYFAYRLCLSRTRYECAAHLHSHCQHWQLSKMTLSAYDKGLTLSTPAHPVLLLSSPPISLSITRSLFQPLGLKRRTYLSVHLLRSLLAGLLYQPSESFVRSCLTKTYKNTFKCTRHPTLWELTSTIGMREPDSLVSGYPKLLCL